MNMFEKIINAVPDKEFDAVLVLSPVNRRYITGFPSSAGYVIVRPDKTVFITDFRYYEAAKKKCGNGIEVILQKKLYDQINACLESCKKVLVEESFITIFSFEVLKEKLSEKILYTGASEALGVLRSVKTQEEICKIAKAQQITDDAFSYIVNYIADNFGLGLTEAQVALEVGKVFETEKNIVSYENLGIGRLIYQLPTTLCEMFLQEVFKKGGFESLDRDTLMTIQAFFENNLNVAETSRKLFVHRNTLVYRLEKIRKLTGLDLREFEHAITFKVALMVKKYLSSKPAKL